MTRLLRKWRRFSLAIPFLLSLLACSVGGSSTGVTTHTPTPVVSPTATSAGGTPSAGDTPVPSTPIPAGITNCNQISTFAGAGAASAGSGFSDVGFPPDSVSVGAGNYADTYNLTTYQFSLISVCSNNATASTIQSYFSSTLTTGGWSNTSTFPYAGNPARLCGDPYCWRYGATPVRYVSLESVQPSDSVVVYTLRVGTAPSPNATVVVRSNSILTGGSNQTVSVSCQGNEQMLGGGFLSHNPGGDPPAHPSFTPDASYPSAANTWTVTSGATGYALNLTAYASCLQANYTLGLQIVHNQLALSSSQDLQATCPGGGVVTGGGFKLVPGGDFGRIDSSGGFNSGWDAHVHTSVSSTADAWAICATTNLHLDAQNLTSVSVALNAIGMESVGCGSGNLLTSGGYNTTSSGYLNDYGSYPDSGNANWLTDVWNESLSSAFVANNQVVCNTLAPHF